MSVYKAHIEMVQAGFEPATPAFHFSLYTDTNNAVSIQKMYKHHALPTTLLDRGGRYTRPIM